MVGVMGVGRAPWRRTRVIVGVSGSPRSLAALRLAVAAARDREAHLYAVLVKPRLSPPAAARSVRLEWQAEGFDRLRRAFDEALGGLPDCPTVHLEVLPGEPADALVAAADLPDDLLVVSRSRPSARRWLGRSVDQQCLSLAQCPVLITPAPISCDVQRLDTMSS
jgi:nucleotide-binding universal stress UspA family protein